jgi:hypothetical protein
MSEDGADAWDRWLDRRCRDAMLLALARGPLPMATVLKVGAAARVILCMTPQEIVDLLP